MSQASNKVAIVTGASRGIGAGIAKRLARDGFAVIVNYSGSKATADDVVATIETGGGRAMGVQGDVSDSAAMRALFDAAEKAFGGVDVLVNNAGVMALKPVAEMDDATYERMVSINLKGTFNGMREAGKRLRNGGRIINLSTSVVGTKMENYGIYAATKAAVETLTPIVAKELRGRSITVNAVAPGPTGTDLFFEGKSQELIDRMAKMSPLERLGTPDDIAAAVAFLAGPDGAWVNGQVIRANGGLV